MKMVFYSADRLEVERLSQDLAAAGIECEVRTEVVMADESVDLQEAELWVRKDDDSAKAFRLSIERNAGFAKREVKPDRSSVLDEILVA
jgi:hypothetical protein